MSFCQNVLHSLFSVIPLFKSRAPLTLFTEERSFLYQSIQQFAGNHFSWSENISHNVSPSLFFPIFYLSALWVIKHPMNCGVIQAKMVTIFLRYKSSMARAALYCTLLKHKLNGTQADIAFNQSAALLWLFKQSQITVLHTIKLEKELWAIKAIEVCMSTPTLSTGGLMD